MKGETKMNGCNCQTSDYRNMNSMDTQEKFSVAMAYIPWQRFGQCYELKRALEVGTVFPELNKPFLGKRGGCK